MKITTWNVNSLTARLQHVLDWLAANPVDVLCLQELKLTDDKFPLLELQAAGYPHCAVFGQKTYKASSNHDGIHFYPAAGSATTGPAGHEPRVRRRRPAARRRHGQTWTAEPRCARPRPRTASVGLRGGARRTADWHVVQPSPWARRITAPHAHAP